MQGEQVGVGKQRGLAAGLFVVVLLVWWGVTAAELVGPVFLPSPQGVVRAFWEANTCTQRGSGVWACGAQDYFLWQHLLASIQRILVGVGVGALFGVGLGFAMGTNRVIGALLDPYLNFLRALPPLGYIGLLIIWFGIGDASKVWLLFLAAFPPIAIATIDGVRGVERDKVLAARTLGASKGQVLRAVIAPGALPSIVTGVRVATGFAWTTVVAAELSNGIPGIGGLAYVAGTQLDTALTIACIIVIGVVAIALDSGIRALGGRVAPWQGRG